jgi:hypothetical protein
MDLCPRSKDADGLHGKTDSFMGFDEIHGLRDHALFEAMGPLNCYATFSVTKVIARSMRSANQPSLASLVAERGSALVADRSKPGMIGRRLIRKIASAKENCDG